MGYYKNCIVDKGFLSQEDFEAKLAADYSDGAWTALAIYTGGVACFTWNGQLEEPIYAAPGDKSDFDHLLELRLFNEEGELHALRGAMGKPFSWRFVVDCKEDPEFAECVLEEDQFLDINEKRSNSSMGEYCSIGGGCYSLPVADAQRIRLYNYVDFDEQNIARIVDFRVVEFLKEGEE